MAAEEDGGESEPVDDVDRRDIDGERARVLVIGAGIAGLTAAHELALRGFDVTVVESEGDDREGYLDDVDDRSDGRRRNRPRRIPPVKLGGLASSQYRPFRAAQPDDDSSTHIRPFYIDGDQRLGAPRRRVGHREQTGEDERGRAARQIERIAAELRAARKPADDESEPLIVGEHGFRFFPAYYLHLFDTLQRIPVFDWDEEPTHRSVYDNIVEVTSQAVSTADNQPSLIFPRRPPASLAEFFAITDQLREVGVRPGDLEQIFRLIARYMATSAERRTADFETVSAYEYFVGLDPATGQHAYHYSTAVDQLLRNMPRVLAAFDSEWGDARTNISTFLQLQLRMSEENKADGVLNGPTTDQWFDHWWLELERLGVQFSRAAVAVVDLWSTPSDDGSAGGLATERLSLVLATEEAELALAESKAAESAARTAREDAARSRALDTPSRRSVMELAERRLQAAARKREAAEVVVERVRACRAAAQTSGWDHAALSDAREEVRNAHDELARATRDHEASAGRSGPPAALDHDTADYADAQKPILLIDQKQRRQINAAFLAVVKRKDVRRSLRRMLRAIPSAQQGVVHPHHLRDARSIALIVETLLGWLGVEAVTVGSAAWLIDNDTFRELESRLEAPNSPFMDQASPRETHDALQQLWSDLRANVGEPPPDEADFEPIQEEVRTRFREHLSAQVLDRMERAIELHRRASRATLAIHYEPDDHGNEVRPADLIGGDPENRKFDYCVIAVPPHKAERVCRELRQLGVGGVVRELDGFTTLSPPPLGPLEPGSHRSRRRRVEQLRCPVCMSSLGTRAWDRFQTLAGIQFYFPTEFQLALGHVYYADSEWALSSINQQGMWERRPNLRQDGYVSVLSVDIGDWNREVPIVVDPGGGEPLTEERLAARDCSPDQLAQEVWRQICNSLIGEMHPEMMDLDRGRDRDIQRWAERFPRPLWYSIDRNLIYGPTAPCPNCGREQEAGGGPIVNEAPYLVPIVGDWFNRPGGFPWNPHGTSMIIRPTERIWRRELRDSWTWQARHGGYQVHFAKPEHEGGLVFAGTWNKTFTRMTTMEAACESGRHAVNALLDHFLWINTEEQREFDQRPIIRPPDATPIEHMTGPVRHPTARGDYCFVFDIENREPMDFRPTRLLDRRYFFDDRQHPWDLAWGRALAMDDFSSLNPLSPAYLERLVDQLRDWRSLLEGLNDETRPQSGRSNVGRPPVSVAADSRYPHRKLFYVPGTQRVYEFMALPDTVYQEHLATALSEVRDSAQRANAGYDRMGRPINRYRGSL